MTLELTATVPGRSVDLSLRVETGEVAALLGPNGAGKSTALALVAGLLSPDPGVVRLDGRTLTAVGDEHGPGVRVPPHARQVALMAQDPLLFPHLSVLENVAFGPRSRGATRRAAHETALRWLGEVGAADLADRRPAQLSGGQAQRVAVARALAGDPRLLLLDEPMAALDVSVAPALRQTLRRVLAGKTAVVVTHDVLDALLLADRVFVMDEGRVVEAGPAAQVLTHPRSPFAARIAGLNMVRGRWYDGAVHGDAGLRVEGLAVGPAPVTGEAAVAVFRPSAVSVFRAAPGGSPRNSLDVVVTDVAPLGDQIRVHAAEVSADITVHAAADLDLAPGDRVFFSVKASEVAVYPT